MSQWTPADTDLFPFIAQSLPSPPLPLYQHRQKCPEVEFRPQALEEDNLRVAVALPEHEVAQSLHTRRPHQEIQAREPGREHVVVNDGGGDGFGVGIDASLRRFGRLEVVVAFVESRGDGVERRFGI